MFSIYKFPGVDKDAFGKRPNIGYQSKFLLRWLVPDPFPKYVTRAFRVRTASIDQTDDITIPKNEQE